MPSCQLCLRGESFARIEFDALPRQGDEISVLLTGHEQTLFRVLRIRHVIDMKDNHVQLDVQQVQLEGPLAKFKIGEPFRMGGNTWRCTDIGTRTIAAIKLNPDYRPDWFNGPPYAVEEVVIDENDLPACVIFT